MSTWPYECQREAIEEIEKRLDVLKSKVGIEPAELVELRRKAKAHDALVHLLNDRGRVVDELTQRADNIEESNDHEQLGQEIRGLLETVDDLTPYTGRFSEILKGVKEHFARLRRNDERWTFTRDVLCWINREYERHVDAEIAARKATKVEPEPPKCPLCASRPMDSGVQWHCTHCDTYFAKEAKLPKCPRCETEDCTLPDGDGYKCDWCGHRWPKEAAP
jgi:ribosomal protein L37AE/L43A